MGSLLLLVAWLLGGVGQLLVWLLAAVVVPFVRTLTWLSLSVLLGFADLVGLSPALPLFVIVVALALIGLGGAGLVAVVAWSAMVLLLSAGPWLLAGVLVVVVLGLLLRRPESMPSPPPPEGVVVGLSDWEMD